MIKSRQEIDERSFSRAAGADDGDHFPGVCREGNVPQYRRLRVVAETHVIKFHDSRKRRKRTHTGFLGKLIREGQVLENFGAHAKGLLELLINRSQTFHWLIRFQQRINKGDKNSSS